MSKTKTPKLLFLKNMQSKTAKLMLVEIGYLLSLV
jgi:hypothetical protein